MPEISFYRGHNHAALPRNPRRLSAHLSVVFPLRLIKHHFSILNLIISREIHPKETNNGFSFKTIPEN